MTIGANSTSVSVRYKIFVLVNFSAPLLSIFIYGKSSFSFKAN